MTASVRPHPRDPKPHIRLMLADVTVVFLLSRLLFYGATALALLTIPEYSGSQYVPWHVPAPALVEASWRWDAAWYLTIMRDGYHWQPGESNLAFFPLYPLLVRGTLLVLPPNWLFVIGILINHVLFFAALMVIWHYAEFQAGRAVARRTIYFLSIFPTSFFFSAAYSEPAFLLVSAASLALLQRGKFLSAGLAGFFATLTRPTGLLLAVPYLVEVYRQREATWPTRPRRFLSILLIPAGIAAFMAYLSWTFGNPLLFLKAQSAWGHTWMFPLVAVFDAAKLAVTGQLHGVPALMNLINTVAAIWALVLGVLLWRWNAAGAAFVLVSALVPLTSAIDGMPTISMARYVVVLFPLFVLLARWTATRWMQVLVTVLFLPANILLTMLFVRWYWII